MKVLTFCSMHIHWTILPPNRSLSRSNYTNEIIYSFHSSLSRTNSLQTVSTYYLHVCERLNFVFSIRVRYELSPCQNIYWIWKVLTKFTTWIPQIGYQYERNLPRSHVLIHFYLSDHENSIYWITSIDHTFCRILDTIVIVTSSSSCVFFDMLSKYLDNAGRIPLPTNCHRSHTPSIALGIPNVYRLAGDRQYP